MVSAVDTELLVVEDNPNDLELTLRTLKKHGASSSHISVAKDGAEALDFLFAKGSFAGRAGEKPPRVILLDLKLPKVTGIEVLKILKSDDRTRSIPVVVLTSSQQEKDVTESYRLGANSYIVKPVEFGQFSHAVSQLSVYWLGVNHPPF